MIQKITFLLFCVCVRMLSAQTCTNVQINSETTFAAAGKLNFAFAGGGAGTKLLAQPDGKYLVAGYVDSLTNTNEDVLVARFNANGTLDPTFGVNGHAVYNYGNHDNRVYDMVLTSDNKIILAGYTQGLADKNVFVMKLTSNGTLDPSFGPGPYNGYVEIDAGFNFDEEITSVGLDLFENIVLGGHIKSGSYKNLFVARITQSGVLDSGFGTSGIWSSNISSGGDDIVNDILINNVEGIIYLGGTYYNSSTTSYDSYVFAINTAGTAYVTSFSGDGQFFGDLSSGNLHDGINALQLLSDGKLIFTGYTTSANSVEGKELLVGCIATDGTLDAGFGTNGVTPPLGYSNSDEGKCIALQPDGKIFVGGYHFDMAAGFIVRLNADGTFDTSFDAGADGTYTSPDFTLFTSLIVSSNGRLLGTGVSISSDLSVKSHRIKCMPTISYSGLSLAYGDEDIANIASSGSTGTFTYSVKSGSVYVSVDASTGEVTTEGAGTAQLKVYQAPAGTFYGDSAFATVTVSKAVITASPQNSDKVYGDVNPSFLISYSGFKFFDNAGDLDALPSATTGADEQSVVGYYNITVSGGSDNDYTFNTSATATLEVYKKTLLVTANTLSREEGEANPTLTYTIDGFVNDENETYLNGAIVLTTTADETSTPGGYPITVDLTGVSSSNYNFTKVDGLLTVTIATGIFSEEKSYTLHLFPNPSADGHIRIESENEISEIQVINSLGQEELFYSEEISTSMRGVLTVIVKSNEKTFIGKIIIEE